MTKAPLIGLVKTRLVPPLTEEETASLSACFLRDPANNIADIGLGLSADGVVVYAPQVLRQLSTIFFQRSFDYWLSVVNRLAIASAMQLKTC